MSFSLNEVEATAKKAARGAGYSWGLAEEAGKATRWLCAYGHDGVAELARLLELGFAENLAAHSPQDIASLWRSEADLCPLVSGALLSDLAASLPRQGLTLKAIARPLLLVPFAAMAARCGETCLVLETEQAAAVSDGIGLELTGTFEDAADLTISHSARREVEGHCTPRATPQPADWTALETWAGKTYAPATEESRNLGAGAGLSDND